MSENETQAMNQNGFYAKKFRQAGLEQLKGRWTTPVLVSLVVTVISLGLVCVMLPWEFYIDAIKSTINGTEPDVSLFPWARYFIGLFLVMMFMPVISLAQISIYPALYNSKEPVKFSDFIAGFSLWGKGLGIFWWRYLWMILWELLGFLIGFVLGLVVGGIAYAISKESMAMAMCIPFCMYIPTIIIVIVKAYAYSLMEYAIADNNDVKVTQAMEISKELTKGYKWKLFCLDFSFIGWELLVCLFPVGELWLNPYQISSKFCAFRYLLDEFNKNMESKLAAAKPRAIEDEPVSPEVDTTDGNEI